MQHVSFLPLPLAFFVACGTAGAPARDDVLPYGEAPLPGGAVPVASLARGPACSFYPCFEACGHNIAIATVEPAFGFSETESVPWRWLRGAEVTGGRVLGIDQQRVELRDAADLRLLGSSPLAGRMPTALGDRVWMQTHPAALAEIDTVSDTPTVTAWWFDAGPVAGAPSPPAIGSRADMPRIELLGAVRDRLLVRTGSGFAAIDPDVGGPREAFCIETPASSIWTQSALLGDVLAIAEMSTDGEPLVAHLLRVSADGASEYGSLPIGAEVPLGGQGDRLTLTSDNRRRITSYDVSGPAPVELAVADGVPTETDDAPLGGFELRGFGRRRVALDLRGHLERYDVRLLDDAPCLWRLEPQAGGAAYLVSPLWPDERRPAEPVPAVTCPERRSEYYADAMALSPDERSVLFGDRHFNLWIIRELASGEEQADAMLPAPGGRLPGGDAHWIGDRVVISTSVGGDYGVETVTTLTIASALPPRTLFGELRSPGPVLALRATARDLWALSYAKGYEGDGPLPNERVLWRLDPAAGPQSMELLSGVPVGAFDQLAAHGEHAYLATPEKLRVIARDGTLTREVSLPASPTSIAASELGAFITDGSERLWQLAPDAESWTLLTGDCPGCELLGASGERVYVTLHTPRDARGQGTRLYDALLGYQELRAYAIAPGGATLVGRQPLALSAGHSAAAVAVGATRVVVNEGTLRVLAPLAEVPQ